MLTTLDSEYSQSEIIVVHPVVSATDGHNVSIFLHEPSTPFKCLVANVFVFASTNSSVLSIYFQVRKDCLVGANLAVTCFAVSCRAIHSFHMYPVQ